MITCSFTLPLYYNACKCHVPLPQTYTFILFIAGGDITVTRKNENSRLISLDIPFYITTNAMPQFRHASSVMTRLATFNTVTLPKWLMKTWSVANYFVEHAMEHAHWMALEIDNNRHLIPSGELFYEGGTERRRTSVDVAREKARMRIRTSRMYGTTMGLHRALPMDAVHEVVISFFAS